MTPRYPMSRSSLPWPVALFLALGPGGWCASEPLVAQESPSTVEDTVTVIRDLNAAPRPSARAVRATDRIQVDGRLDEAAWGLAPVIDRFVQQRPFPGEPVSERTEVRILYDDENLYIGAELYDSNPSGIVHTTLQREANTAQGDALGFSFDTFRDGRTGVVFFVNPGGALRDAETSDDGRVRNLAWNTATEVRTRVHELGWTVEMAIPWSALRFEGGREEQVWGLNVFRRIRRKNEEATWAPMDRGWSIYNVSRSGTLVGLDGVRPGRNLSVKPYVLGSRPAGFLQVGVGPEIDIGVDAKYGITSGITLDLTLNTDFSQVEADQPQVNLTRFSLFFPERREFFLENEALFQFGDRATSGQRSGASNRDLTLFHSRRIGLTPSGGPLPILGGGRVTGTAGPLSVGLINMQTRSSGDFTGENFTVARLRGAARRNLTVGGILVNRTATSGADATNRSYGVDVDLTAFSDYLLVQSYLAATEGTRLDGTPLDRDFAGRLSIAWRDPLWEAGALVRQLGEDFEPGVGFVRRRGIRHLYGTLGLRPRVFWGVVEEMNPYIETHYFGALAGGVESRELVGGLGIGFRDGSSASIDFTDRFERVHSPFSVGSATVPVGDHEFREGSVSYGSSGGRALSGKVTLGGGGYFTGTRRSISGSLLGRVSYRAALGLSADNNRIALPGQEAVDAAAYSARLEYFFSTRILTTGVFQYDEAASELVTNLRFNWVHAPLSDLYLVLTERRDADANQVLERLVTLKVTKLLSF